ncbi:FAD-dependent oxidoreductase [Pseudomonas sp. PhalM4]
MDELIHELGYVKVQDSVVGERIVSGLASGQPHVISLSDFAKAIAGAIRLAGGEVIENSPVASLLMKNNRVHGVATGSGHIEADEVVICAGLQSEALINAVGLTLQLKAAENRLGASSARQGVPGVFHGTVPLTPSGEPCLGRPEGLDGLFIAVGHDTNPAAAIAVGQMLAQALDLLEHSATLLGNHADYALSHSIQNVQ